VDAAIEEAQSARLAALRAGRDDAAVKRGLDELRTAAEGSANVLYPLRSALQASATVGEVCDALREVWGTYQPPDAY
jgi:methylmalonyl-CoA mutase N-terminal domain/subunit